MAKLYDQTPNLVDDYSDMKSVRSSYRAILKNYSGDHLQDDFAEEDNTKDYQVNNRSSSSKLMMKS